MPTKKSVIGTSFHDQVGRRTSGQRARQANAARQNASRGPDQPARYGDLTKKPLVLHITAATKTSNRACRSEGIAERGSPLSGDSAAEPGSSNPKSSSMISTPTNRFPVSTG